MNRGSYFGKLPKRVCLLLLLAAVLRLGWAMSRPASAESLEALPDQVEYLTLAQNLLQGQGLSFIDPRFNDRVYAFRTPGYPLFVAACGSNVRCVRAVQALLDASTVLAAFLLARRVMPGDRTRPFVAAVIVAFNPLLIYFCGLLLSETLFVAMLTWGMVLVFAGFAAPNWADKRGEEQQVGEKFPPMSLAGGVILAVAVLVRPSAAGLPLVLGVGAVIANRRQATAYQLLIKPRMVAGRILLVGTTMTVLVMTVLVVFVLTPWALRNLRMLHHLICTDTNAGFTLYDGYNADATGASDQSFVKDMPILRTLDEFGRSTYLADRAKAFAVAHPQRVLELIGLKAARMWSPVTLSGQFGGTLYRTALFSYSAPFDLLVLWGLWKGNLRRSSKVFLLLPAIYLTAIHALTIGSLRYRIPAEPALAVLAACAWKWKNRSASVA